MVPSSSTDGLLLQRTLRMIEKLRRDRVGLGIIGVGPGWEQTYRETLIRLQNKISIRLVYDSVEARARTVAFEFDADVADSMRQILFRPGLQGLLVLDLGWCGAGALSLIAQCRKPVYLANPALRQTSALKLIAESSHSPTDSETPLPSADDLMMPELGHRFTPASCRLRELIVTKIGAVREILIECDPFLGSPEIAQRLDWCSDLTGQDPIRFARTTEGSNGASVIELEYQAVSASSKPRFARLIPMAGVKGSDRITVECEHGRATIAGRTRIAWQCPTSSAEESLTEERSEVDILLDQFCRRAVGGLNPVGRLSDYVRAIKIVEALGGSQLNL